MFCTLLVILVVFITPFFLNRAWAPVCSPCYTATSSLPSVNSGQNVTITIRVTSGTPLSSYQFTITVTKPGGALQGQSSTTNPVVVPTDATGGGSGAFKYPNNGAGWTTISGTPANTDIPGTYQVSIDKTFPNPAQTGVATTSFRVVTNLTVTIQSPTTTGFSRGQVVTITATVFDNSSLVPITTATVTATTPRSTIGLPPTTPAGTYSSQYLIQISDPLGPWNIFVRATWGSNSGNSTDPVTIQYAQLVVTDLTTYNAYGTPTSDFSSGGTMYATFRITYSPSGAFLTSGSFNIQVLNPSGGTEQNLVAVYDSNRGLFYTPSGFQVSSSDTAGTWQLVFPMNSLNDTYGNTGPANTIAYRFQIHQNQFIISPFYFIVAALAIGGGLGATVVLRRFNTTTAPFEDLFKLTGGEIQPPVSLMIAGDAGAGSTTLGLQLLFRDLVAGKACGLLSYDSFPSEVKRKMRDMGWDITPHLERGQMKILDCYSALAGVEGAPIKDPTDFTEVSIQVTGMIERVKKGPTTILLDSVTPIFNSATAKDCINFLQVLAAKVKNAGGTFILTAAKGSIPEDAMSKIESLADGVIELSLVKRAKNLARFLMVKKISGRQISSQETEFEIATGKGILLKRQRIPVSILTK